MRQLVMRLAVEREWGVGRADLWHERHERTVIAERIGVWYEERLTRLSYEDIGAHRRLVAFGDIGWVAHQKVYRGELGGDAFPLTPGEEVATEELDGDTCLANVLLCIA